MSRRPPSGMKGSIPSKSINPVVPGTGRPGSRSVAQGGMGVLNSQIKVADRPVTQQGLRGIKTGSKGPNRQVQDRSYFLGILRGKIQELSHEIADMNKEIEIYNQENATFLTFEKRAEVLAGQIKELQGEMADYNTLMDKVNTDTEVDVVLTDYEMLKKKNEKEAKNIDTIFAKKQEAEKELEGIMMELDSKRSTIESMVSSMDESVSELYRTLMDENTRIKKDLLEEQDTLDSLASKAVNLKEEISQSAIKQEAFHLHQQLAEVTASLEECKKTKEETPQEEQERLLQQVKADNQEMGSMEKRCGELHDQLAVLRDQLTQLNSDLTNLHGERSEKYKELKRREDSMREFLETFQANKGSEKEKIENLESNIVIMLEHISQSITQSEHLPTTGEFDGMQANLAFKKGEKEKSEATSRTLDDENFKLQCDLRKVEDLEDKITAELTNLKTEIDAMTKEIIIYSDLEGLHMSEEEKRQFLAEEKKNLLQRRTESQKSTKQLSHDYEMAKSQFTDNDTFSQLNNLERKWQHHEQNNFAVQEFIAAKQTEGNYMQVSKDVANMILEYNGLLCNSLSGINSPHTS